MKAGRVCILMMDSLGIGAASDAKQYGDEKANTLGHILKAYPHIKIPTLTKWGLLHALKQSSGLEFCPADVSVNAKYGFAAEQSLGKDTPSGHWEMMGVPVLFDWGYFPDVAECFPPELIQELVVQAGLPGVLGNCHASGTTIIEQWGEEHLKTGKPIVYTSADSVFQIAAHEETFGLQRLYEVCEIARKLVDKYQVGRVIARPFVGKVGAFKRTANRKDYTTPPHRDTLLDVLKSHGHQVIAIGKIADIFAHKGISQVIFAEDNHQLFEATMKAMQTAEPGSLVFTNFVDFDSKYGHRRDVQGYAKALEDFDVQLQQFEQQLQADDLIFIVADHGCDPTQPGSDHTREYIPVIMYGKQVTPGFIGKRDSFSDVGQTIATFLDVPAMSDGTSFLHQ